MDFVPAVCEECGRRDVGGVDARFCSICGRLVCAEHPVAGGENPTCETCVRIALDPFDADQKRAIEKVQRDLQQTISTTTVDRPIEDIARGVQRFTSGIEDFEARLVHEVQQAVHDLHIDTSWPSCPLDPNHPLWFEGGWWRCEAVNKRFSELVSLPRGQSRE